MRRQLAISGAAIPHSKPHQHCKWKEREEKTSAYARYTNALVAFMRDIGRLRLYAVGWQWRSLRVVQLSPLSVYDTSVRRV